MVLGGKSPHEERKMIRPAAYPSRTRLATASRQKQSQRDLFLSSLCLKTGFSATSLFTGDLTTSATCLTRGGADNDVVAVCVKFLASVAASAGVDDVGSVAREIAAAGSDGVCVLSSGCLV